MRRFLFTYLILMGRDAKVVIEERIALGHDVTKFRSRSEVVGSASHVNQLTRRDRVAVCFGHPVNQSRFYNFGNHRLQNMLIIMMKALRSDLHFMRTLCGVLHFLPAESLGR